MNRRNNAILQIDDKPAKRGFSLAGVLLAGLMLILTLAGCNQTSSDSGSGDGGDGQVVIGLTDAKGDFSSYTVDVTALTLTKANGAVVNVLPLTTRVDFAQYTDMTEFLTAAMVPNGVYVKGTLSLDYSDADIRVENEAGDSVKAGTIQDSDGNPITTLDVSIQLEGRNKLVIAPGIPAHITFDFNLDASNKVEFADSTSATVTVEPFLVADAELQAPKTHRLRGPLSNVDVAASEFSVIMRPFHQPIANDLRFGSLTVKTSEDTLFEINDESYAGSAGLTVLDTLPRLTAMIVIGDLKFNPRRFEAREVYAGSSVPGGDMDVVKGTVMARSGDVLSVKGATLIRTDGSVIFNDMVQVTVSDSTRVKKQLSMLEHNIGEISVGQRISVFGSLTNDSVDDLQMDASAGLVRMKVTTLRGTRVNVVSIPENPPFVMDLQSIDGRRTALFDFSGTGADSSNDADPAYYEINTGSLVGLPAILAGTPVKAYGFVTPFGSAPSDFDAVSVVDLTSIPAIMTMNWAPETTAPFLATSAESLTLNFDGVGLFHHVGRGGVVQDLADLTGDPQILAPADGSGVFEIRQGGTRQWHSDFATFVTDLETRLADGGAMKRIAARGMFNDDNVSITANLIVVVMK